MKVLIPLMPTQQLDLEFLMKASEDASEVRILVVLDQAVLGSTAGGAVSSIASLEEVAEEMVAALKGKKKKADYLVEWGSLADNACKRAIQFKADKIAVQRLPVSFFTQVLKGLEKGAKCKVEVL